MFKEFPLKQQYLVHLMGNPNSNLKLFKFVVKYCQNEELVKQ